MNIFRPGGKALVIDYRYADRCLVEHAAVEGFIQGQFFAYFPECEILTPEAKQDKKEYEKAYYDHQVWNHALP